MSHTGELLLQSLLVDAAAERDRYRAALEEIACMDDRRANDWLESTGSWSAFDEPGSVRIARQALEVPHE